ncbi:ATP-binding protein [Mesorhizobium sp. M0904]|uniref:ATP-binding protein n=1 Tax=Mesorhizobium sp. M0904 TaxID=2957022 RepID=UPI003334EFBB
MTTLDHDLLIAILDRLKLTAIRDQLDTLLDEAARSKMTLREALAFLASSEIARRDERRISMSSKIAQFPFVRELDGFDFTRSHRSASAKRIHSYRTGLAMSERHCAAKTLEFSRNKVLDSAQFTLGKVGYGVSLSMRAV